MKTEDLIKTHKKELDWYFENMDNLKNQVLNMMAARSIKEFEGFSQALKASLGELNKNVDSVLIDKLKKAKYPISTESERE